MIFVKHSVPQYQIIYNIIFFCLILKCYFFDMYKEHCLIKLKLEMLKNVGLDNILRNKTIQYI